MIRSWINKESKYFKFLRRPIFNLFSIHSCPKVIFWHFYPRKIQNDNISIRLYLFFWLFKIKNTVPVFITLKLNCRKKGSNEFILFVWFLCVYIVQSSPCSPHFTVFKKIFITFVESYLSGFWKCLLSSASCVIIQIIF